MKRIYCLPALFAMFTMAAFADIRPPDTPRPTPEKPAEKVEPVDATLHIEFSPTEKTARLVIPRSRLKELRAELEGLDDAGGAFAGFTRTQTIVSGLFLSLAVVFGGVWFVRSGKAASKKAKIAAAAALLFFSGAFASAAFGNIGPSLRAPITNRIFNEKAFNHPLGIQGAVKLEVSDQGEWLRLIVPAVKADQSE